MMNLKRTYPYIFVMLEALEIKKQTKKKPKCNFDLLKCKVLDIDMYVFLIKHNGSLL